MLAAPRPCGPHRSVGWAGLATFALPWPWESLHAEILAWFDQWLKGRDTGIMDGPPIRYVVPGTDGWRTAEQWPPKADLTELHLHADGRLAATDGSAGSRRYDSATGR